MGISCANSKRVRYSASFCPARQARIVPVLNFEKLSRQEVKNGSVDLTNLTLSIALQTKQNFIIRIYMDKEIDYGRVVIDCMDSNRGVKKHGDEATIHRQLLEELTKEIRHSFVDAEERDDMEDEPFIPEVNNHNYFITGGRGSGKSTFLRKLVARLESVSEHDTRFQRLCWYDPSESFGVNENFFITVVAALKSKLDEVLRQGRNRANNYEYEVDCCKQTMKKLDSAIVRLSHKRDELSELSEHKASMLRADNAETNNEIRQNFSRVVRLLCHLCKVKAFIIAIDDIDTRTAQCYHVLENLRLFISNANLIILMAGDKSMNIERIREKQFEEYSYHYHKADVDGQEVRMSAVVTHAGQYMAKLFPISHQRELRNLLTLSQKRLPIHVYLRTHKDQKGGERTLREYVTEAFSYTISQETSDIISYVDQFMCLPLRSIMQIVDYWSRHQVWDKLDDLIKLKEEEARFRHMENLQTVKKEYEDIKAKIEGNPHFDTGEVFNVFSKVMIEATRAKWRKIESQMDAPNAEMSDFDNVSKMVAEVDGEVKEKNKEKARILKKIQASDPELLNIRRILLKDMVVRLEGATENCEEKFIKGIIKDFPVKNQSKQGKKAKTKDDFDSNYEVIEKWVEKVCPNNKKTCPSLSPHIKDISSLLKIDICIYEKVKKVQANVDEVFYRLFVDSTEEDVEGTTETGTRTIHKNLISSSSKKEGITKEDLKVLKSKVTEVTYRVREALNRTLIDQLHEEYGNFGSLNANDANTFYAIMLKHCQNLGDLDYGYFLSGDIGRNTEHKWVTMLLALNFRNHIKDLKGFISYLLYGPATVSLYAKALRQYQGEKTELSTESLARFRRMFSEYLHVGSWSSPSRWARRANMIWCGHSQPVDIHSGVWCPSEACMRKIQEYLKYQQDKLEKRAIVDKRIWVAIALIVSMNKSEERDNSYYISVYSYLAFILLCVQTCDNYYLPGTADEDQKKKMERSLVNVLTRYVPIKTCFKPDWQKESNRKTNNVDIEFESYSHISLITLQSIQIVHALAREIVEWYLKEKAKMPTYEDISPRKMGLIWSNFYSSMRSLSHKATRKPEDKSQAAVEGVNNADQNQAITAEEMIKNFRGVIKYFVMSFCSPTSDELKCESRIYREALASFPLTKCLKEYIDSRESSELVQGELNLGD